MELLLYKEKCTQCKKCVLICHKGPVVFDIDKKEIKDIKYCNACSLCVTVCPGHALQLVHGSQQ
jgi:Pyruvate/2-oxoacid:ferredoxin oxidoreductase delta subunit